MLNFKRLMLAGSLLFIWLTACNQQNNQDNQNNQAAQAAQQQIAAAQIDSLQKIVAHTSQRFHSYKNDTLIQILVAESSKQKEPFNSLAYRELVTRKDVSADTLAAIVRRLKDRNALLPLILLRNLNGTAYKSLPAELRAGVLTDALRASKMFNTWGFPPFYLQDASVALIDCGRPAVPALKQMLRDTSAAPVFGSKQYMEYLHYRYRLCDYALFFIRKIEDPKFIFPTARDKRDSLISVELK
jgi:hypothetical protein